MPTQLQMHLDARQQLFNDERFDQVIGGAPARNICKIGLV
jgi:hypothetical protein